MNLARLLYQGNLTTALSSFSRADMIWSTTTCGWTRGARKLNSLDLGNWTWEKSAVWVNEGRTKVVRIAGVLYLSANISCLPIEILTLTGSRARSGGTDAG